MCASGGGDFTPNNNMCVFTTSEAACRAGVNYMKELNMWEGQYGFVSIGTPYTDSFGNPVDLTVCILSSGLQPVPFTLIATYYPLISVRPVARCDPGSITETIWRTYNPSNPASLPVCTTEKPAKNKDCCGGACVGNPINAASGNKCQHEVDLPENGPALSFTRHFNLIEPLAKSNMGYGWSHTYARWVKAPPYDTQATVRRPNGTEYNFRYSASTSTWVSDADVTDRLVERLDGSGLRIGWRYTSSSDEVERYDLEGRLLSITDRAGRTLSLDYSTLETISNSAPTVGLLLKVKDNFGHQLRFTYDANSRLVTMTDPSGGVHTYAYSPYTYAYVVYDHLSSVTRPDGTSRTYLYENNAYLNAPHALTGILDENGNRAATWTYGVDGRAVSSEHALGAEKYTIAYTSDATRNVIRTTVTDAAGTVNTHAFQTIHGVVKNTSITQTCAGCVSSSATTSYDANGNVASRIDFNGNRTNYTYDLARNLETSRTEGLTAAGANTAVTRTITTTWHPSYRIPTSITGAGRVTTYTYDSGGNILSVTVGAAPLNTRTVSMAYNASGQVMSIDGPRTDVADVTTLAYYDCNTGGGCGQLLRATNALGHVTTYDSYDNNGRLLQLTDPNGVKTAYAYDARGRVQSLTQTTPSGDSRVTRYGYDAAGNVTSTLLPTGLSLTYIYDAAAR